MVARARAGHVAPRHPAVKTSSLAQQLRASSTPPEGQDGQGWATARAVLHQEASPEAAEALVAVVRERLGFEAAVAKRGMTVAI